MSGVRLRPYQEDCLKAIHQAIADGKRRMVVSIPTGGGKTVVFSHLIAGLELSQRALVLAHRDELILQTVDKIKMVTPKADIGIVKASENQYWTQTVVASVQTVQNDRRLASLGHFDLVIVDECHHAVAESWTAILTKLGAFEDDGPVVIGFTATPKRGDEVGLDAVFDEIVYDKPILELMNDQYLVDVRAAQVQVEGLDFSGIKRVGGDLPAGATGKAMMNADAPEYVARAIKEYASERRSLVFTPTVMVAEAVAEAANQVGLVAASLDGKTATSERRRLIREFHDGAIQVLSNCLDSETEILTRRGWIGEDDFREDDMTAAVDPQSGVIRWEPVSRVVRREVEYGERMVHLSNQSLDIRVTEGHRMLVQTHGAKSWQFVEAGTLPDRLSPYNLRSAGTNEFPGVPLTADELTFLGLFATDGSLNQERASIEIVQSESNIWVCEEIERILTACQFDWKRSRGVGKGAIGQGKGYRRYRIPKGGLSGQLARKGWGRLEAWIDKSLSPHLSAMTTEQFDHLVHGLWLGDGMKHYRLTRPGASPRICGVDWSMFDLLQAWAAQRGRRTTLGIQANDRQFAHSQPLGVLGIKPKGTIQTNNQSVPTSGGNPARFEDPTPGERVWCVTNDTGTIITRRAGKVVVLGQCAVLTEGTDIPPVDCVVIARPTSSATLFQQMVGRGLRPYPGKEDCLVLDTVGVTGRHKLVSVATLFGIDPKVLQKGVPVTEAAREQARQQAIVSEATGKLVAIGIDVTGTARVHWIPSGDGKFLLSCGDGMLVLEADTTEDRWIVSHKPAFKRPEVLANELSLEFAQGVAEDRARSMGADVLIDPNASWRGQEPTDRQLWRLQKLGVDVRSIRTKGEASDAISAALSRRSA